MPKKRTRLSHHKRTGHLLAATLAAALSTTSVLAQQTDSTAPAAIETAEPEKAKPAIDVPVPALVDVTTRDKTLRSIVDAGPPKLEEGQKAVADTAYDAFQRGWFLTALGLATPLAEQGDKAAQALMGVLHEAGLGIRQDKAKAADWYRLAAASGDAGSAMQLGQLYLLGTGVDTDKKKAADYFQQAADAGNASALYNLALPYQEGEGRPFDEAKARELLEEAAKRNDPEAQYALGLSYLEAQTGLNDPGQGAFWIGRAARRGHTSAQVYYGILRFQGKGVDPNEAEAADWFERAATGGNPVAMNRLARVYAYGRGREQDFAAAAGWHLIARTLGVSDFNLDRIVESLDETTMEEARKLAEQYSATLMAPSEDPARETP
ncbi:tetratricopeptide repeat protein [Roseibium sediminicola]|uniref:Sel1 repeat family protein n=1 Tax=Roseibium sediminicola TaxID=2933272 RepID=A0ABT0GVA7_9HYPH|nr:tetratricopeptide repeat protein [Roseibium sp. CAU 1639]MCK7613155.1 sel1 repeat family protein [Roseibium sp. CAU 1639]